MKLKKEYKFILIVLIIFTINSCVEPFDAKTENFENILVIKATLTNEIKYQEIEINHTYKFEENSPIAETNANVKIIDDLQNEYQFHESTDGGVYISSDAFGAQPNRSYQLSIKTNLGKQYISEFAELPLSELNNNLYIYKETDNNMNGISIYMDSYDTSENSRYYRYEYEETYKIVAPYWSAYDLVSAPNKEDGVSLVLKTKEERVCYNTVKFNEIILKNTNKYGENIIEPFLVRFISRDNYIISHRYSMLVKQYALSREAYNFYETLKDFSESGSIFSENQPGFIYGNIVSEDDPEEKVIGFFDVSMVFSKRVYFNFYDFYLGEMRPYPSSCLITSPPESSLWSLMNSGTVKFQNENEGGEGDGPYYLVPLICGDCTVLGTNIVPDFWEE